MADPILDQFVRRATGPEHGNAAMPKSVQARWRQIQLTENLIQLAPHIALAEWRTRASRKHPPAFAIPEVTGQHLNQSRFDVDLTAAVLTFGRNFFSIPDAALDRDLAFRQVHIFDVQPKGLAALH